MQFLLLCLLEEGCENCENSGKLPFIGSHGAYRPSRERTVLQGEFIYCLVYLHSHSSPRHWLQYLLWSFLCWFKQGGNGQLFSLFLLTGWVSCGLRSKLWPGAGEAAVGVFNSTGPAASSSQPRSGSVVGPFVILFLNILKLPADKTGFKRKKRVVFNNLSADCVVAH